MRGIVFTELMDMVEQKFGYSMVDSIIENAKLETGGSYTSVGNYPYSELVCILVELSKQSGLSVDELQVIYGEHLFTVFSTNYPVFFDQDQSALQFLASVESKIHPEVHKLYPDAELPSFDVEHLDSKSLTMVYSSERKMGMFAEGLIKGCLTYFNESADILKDQLTEDGSKVRFTITRRA